VLISFVILLHHGIESVSGTCPATNLLHPCTCSSDNIVCDGNQYINLKHIFNLVSQEVPNGLKNFYSLTISNAAIVEIERNTFYDVTFHTINISDARNLRLIDTYAFGETNAYTRYFHIRNTPVRNLLPNNDLFFMLSLMKNITYIQLENTNITEIPSYAFAPIMGYQTQLQQLYITGGNLQKINDFAFHNLDSLTTLSLYGNSVNFLPKNAFNFRKNSTNILNMKLDSDLFNKTIFQNETFLNTKRPTYLTTICGEAVCEIEYIDEIVFSIFFDLNLNNRLYVYGHLLDCDDCRSFWIIKNTIYIRRIYGLICTNGNELMDNDNFMDCKLDTKK
jgi:hypothetical protein